MKRINNKGVTLIELLVTISLIGILVGVSGDLLFTIFRSFNKSSTIVNIQEEGNTVLNKIKTDAINATTVTIGNGGKTLTLKSDKPDVIYTFNDIGDGYADLIRQVVGEPEENLFKTNTSALVDPKYKLVLGTAPDFYSAFILKNPQSTPKLLVIYLTVIPFNQDDTTSKDLRIEGANARLRTSIVLRGSYDRIN